MPKLFDAAVFLALFCVPITRAQESAAPQVLTVCEALRGIDLYRGKVVVIVGRSNYTFEGPFMHEKCDPDDRILIQGHRWLSAIAVGAEKPAVPDQAFPVGEDILREKLRQLSDYHSDAQGSMVKEEVRTIAFASWVAVYGTLESPAKLKPHMPPNKSNSRNTPGNGYGANGSVPAMILVIRSKDVPPSSDGFRTIDNLRKELAAESQPAEPRSATDNQSKSEPAPPAASKPASCPDPAALDLFKRQIAYERTEETYPLKGLSVIHADVWERGTLTALYIRERLRDFVATVRIVYSVENHEAQSGYTCPVQQNWKECVQQHEDLEAASSDIRRTCAATVDMRTIPAWRPSPNDQTKRRIADELRREIEAKWQGVQQIVIRNFNLKDNQITMYLKMPNGDYFQGCGFSAAGEPHCEGWHLFGQAPVSSIRKWILEKPYRLK